MDRLNRQIRAKKKKISKLRTKCIERKDCKITRLKCMNNRIKEREKNSCDTTLTFFYFDFVLNSYVNFL